MTVRAAPARSPALGLVAPFFLVAPLGLFAAGLLLATAGRDTFVAINLPHTVALTHALVIGWLTTTIMGASYQLAPVVIGGDLWSERLARTQFALHVAAVPAFVWSLLEWELTAMAIAGVLLVVSLLFYVSNMAVAVRRGRTWTLPRAYVAVSLAFLVATISLGATWVGALQPGWLWFPITLARLSAHAHVGLAGWLGLTLMGVSYQLVPMFNVVNRVKPRFGWHVLALTAAGTVVFAAVIAFDPPRPLRAMLAALLAAGPLLWGCDELRLLLGRSRRRLDVQGRATFISLGFLAAAAALGFGAALGTPFTTGDEPARWLLAYGAAGILGWAGTALIGNSYKILPFLIWYHRYRQLVGRGPVPVVADIYSERAATAVLVAHAAAVVLLVGAALAGSLALLQAGGAVAALAAAAHGATMLHMFLPKRASRPYSAPAGEAAPW